MIRQWNPEPAKWAIQVRGLHKRFRNVRAVADLDLNVPLGGVHGLLGPNGSGKTTTIRMLLGLVRADSGTMTILGSDAPARLPDVIDSVGAIVESPRFGPNLSLERNLEILATAVGAPRRRVTEVLLEVGLAGRADSLFRTCSLGMKQRLAIAATLLKQPQLLIFDEPTNGLDPAGIHEIRETMRALADAGRTVLVSSHLLSEVQLIADSVSIIGRGRILAEGHLGSLLTAAEAHVVVEVADPVRAHEVLRQRGYRVEVVGGRLDVRSDDLDAAAVARALGEADLWPTHLSHEQASLESVFLELTRPEHLTATQGRGAA